MEAARTTKAQQVGALRPHPVTGELYLRREWVRRINPAWSDPDDHVGNVLAEISDMYGRRELLSPSDEHFLAYIITHRIRTFADKSQGVYLTEKQVMRLDILTKRFTSAHLAERFLRRKKEIEQGVHHTRRRAFRPEAGDHPWLPRS